MSKRLLVVDDEPNLLRAVAACLKTEGYEVNTARSGREALLQLAEAVPDLVVSDIRMPGMDGYQLRVNCEVPREQHWSPSSFLRLKMKPLTALKDFAQESTPISQNHSSRKN